MGPSGQTSTQVLGGTLRSAGGGLADAGLERLAGAFVHGSCPAVREAEGPQVSCTPRREEHGEAAHFQAPKPSAHQATGPQFLFQGQSNPSDPALRPPQNSPERKYARPPPSRGVPSEDSFRSARVFETNRAGTPARSLKSCVTSGRSLHLSEPQLLHLYVETATAPTTEAAARVH